MSIWKTRNTLNFRQTHVSSMSKCIISLNLFTEWDIHTCIDSLDANFSRNWVSHSPSTIWVALALPSNGCLEINFDGFVRNNPDQPVLLLEIIWVIMSHTCNLGSSSPIHAEAFALRNSLLLAIEHNIHRVFIECDKLLIINIL